MTITYDKTVLLKRGNTAVSTTYTGPLGEVTVDTDLDTLRVHDGVTPGGHILANISQINSNVNLSAVNANVAAANLEINSLRSNITAANSNAGIQATAINSLNANAGAYQTYANANSAVQAIGINNINANIGAYQIYANATFSSGTYSNTNTAAYLSSQNITSANIGAYQVYANANATAQALSLDNLTSNAATQGSLINTINANVAAANTAVTTLTANAATQSTQITLLNANVTAANVLIASLQSNAAVQANILDVLSGNAVTQQSELAALVANAATQGSELTVLIANASAQAGNLTTLISNAATQATAISSINANIGSYQTYANANAAVQATTLTTLMANAAAQALDIDSLTANAATQGSLINTLDSNLGSATTSITALQSNAATQAVAISSINANTGAYQTYANANAAVQAASITTLVANAAAQALDIDSLTANAATQGAAINTINANIGAYQIYANANVVVIQANLGAFQTYANAQFGPAGYSNTNVAAYLNNQNITSANIGAYQTYANANATTQATAIGTVNANLGAFQTYANATFGTSNYGNANVATYLSAFNGNIIPSANVTYSLGDATHQWKDLWVSNNTIYIGNTPIRVDGGALLVNGAPVATTVANLVNGASTFQLFANGESRSPDTIFAANGVSIINANGAIQGGIYNSGDADWFNIGASTGRGIKFYVDEENAGPLFFANGSVNVPSNLYSVAGVIGDVNMYGGTISGTNPGWNYLTLANQVEGSVFVQLPSEATANVGNLRIHNDIGNVEIATGDGFSYNYWYFRKDGNLIIPGNINYANGVSILSGIGGAVNGNIVVGDSQIQFVANSSGDGYGLSTIRLVPYTAGYDSAIIIIDPTYPNHIHMRAGFEQDNAAANLFLGGEASHFNVEEGANPNVSIRSNYYTWTFGTDGTLTLPGGYTLGEPGGPSIRLQAPNTTDTIQLNWANEVSFTLGNTGAANIAQIGTFGGYWNFDDYGNLTIPGDIIMDAGSSRLISVVTPEPGLVSWEFGMDGTVTFPSGGNITFDASAVSVIDGVSSIINTAGNITVTADTSSWLFSANDTLVVPGEGVIRSIDDTITLQSFNTVTGFANSVYVGTSGGLGFADGSIGSNWLEIFRSGPNPQIGTPGNLTIVTDSTNTAPAWNFDNTGNLTLPGYIIVPAGIVGTDASPAPYISGFSSISAQTLLASGNVTAANVSATNNFALPVFVNSSVRDSTITSPQPGMMIFVTGTGMQVRGATQWNTVTGTGT